MTVSVVGQSSNPVSCVTLSFRPHSCVFAIYTQCAAGDIVLMWCPYILPSNECKLLMRFPLSKWDWSWRSSWNANCSWLVCIVSITATLIIMVRRRTVPHIMRKKRRITYVYLWIIEFVYSWHHKICYTTIFHTLDRIVTSKIGVIQKNKHHRTFVFLWLSITPYHLLGMNYLIQHRRQDFQNIQLTYLPTDRSITAVSK